MIHILHIMIGMGSYGGAEQFALSYYENMDKSKIRFDFLFLNQNVLRFIDNPCLKESRIDELGIWKRKINLFTCIKTIKELIKYLKKSHYEIIHINSGIIKAELCCLIAAKIAGVNVRIAHSHTAKPISKGIRERVSDKIKSTMVRNLATDYFACSETAGIHLFGKKGIRSEKYRIVRNAIDLDKYRYDAEKAEYVRQRERVEKGLIFGHVGRFVEVKNQRYLIDVFKRIHDKLTDAKLWMIGDGELFDKIQDYIDACGLYESVKLFGEREDVADLMQSMDALIFPSIFEGLSIVVVEAQAAGLNTFVSDSISYEHRLSNHIWFLSLDSGSEYWSDFIIEKMENYRKNMDIRELTDHGYDIAVASKELQNFYIGKAGIENEK